MAQRSRWARTRYACHQVEVALDERSFAATNEVFGVHLRQSLAKQYAGIVLTLGIASRLCGGGFVDAEG